MNPDGRADARPTVDRAQGQVARLAGRQRLDGVNPATGRRGGGTRAHQLTAQRLARREPIVLDATAEVPRPTGSPKQSRTSKPRLRPASAAAASGASASNSPSTSLTVRSNSAAYSTSSHQFYSRADAERCTAGPHRSAAAVPRPRPPPVQRPACVWPTRTPCIPRSSRSRSSESLSCRQYGRASAYPRRGAEHGIRSGDLPRAQRRYRSCAPAAGGRVRPQQPAGPPPPVLPPPSLLVQPATPSGLGPGEVRRGLAGRPSPRPRVRMRRPCSAPCRRGRRKGVVAALSQGTTCKAHVR